MRAYFFDEGYLRTSSKEYCPEKFSNRLIHLTNDAIQKNSADYGKFESANKISYQDFDKLLEKDHQTSFFDTILPKIRQQVVDVFSASDLRIYKKDIIENKSDVPLIQEDRCGRIPDSDPYNAFELLGFDFMLTQDLKL